MEESAGPVALDAARLLAEWFLELGYLQHADAIQFLHDTFGDVFVGTTEDGRACLRRDVMEALHDLAPLAVAAMPVMYEDD
jgi:hypothetical protein